MNKKLISVVLAAGLIFASAPPACFAQSETRGPSAARAYSFGLRGLSAPVTVAGMADFARLMAQGSALELIEPGLSAGADALSADDLARVLHRAAIFFETAEGPFAVSWDGERKALRLTSSAPRPAQAAQSLTIRPDDPGADLLPPEEKSRLDQLAASLRNANNSEALQKALNRLFEAGAAGQQNDPDRTVFAGEYAGFGPAAKPSGGLLPPEVDKAPDGRRHETVAALPEIKDSDGTGSVESGHALPKSFLWGYIPGWTMAAAGQEILAVALPLYIAHAFGLSDALIVGGIGLVLRIPGAWAGSFMANHFDPTRLNNASLLALAAGAAMIPLGASIHAAWAPSLYGLLVANAVISGLVYGTTRGITENLIPARVIGAKNKEKLARGLNLAYAVVEIAAFLMAYSSPALLGILGSDLMLYAASGVIAAAMIPYSLIKYAEPNQSSTKPLRLRALRLREIRSRLSRGLAGLPSSILRFFKELPGKLKASREVIPFVFFRFAHFSMYSMLSTVIAVAFFKADQMQGNILGSYDAGSFLLGFLASRAGLNPLFSRLDERRSIMITAAVFVSFLWLNYFLRVSWLTSVLAGALGGMITITSNTLMAYYNNTRSEGEVNNLSKWSMTFSTLGVLPMVVAMNLHKIPAHAQAFSIANVFLVSSLAITVVAGFIAYSAHRGFRSGPETGAAPAPRRP